MAKLYTHNKLFFREPNLLNSYWAGFIAADGNIQKRNPVLNLHLSEKDKPHLEKFAQDIEFTGSVKSRVQTSFGKPNNSCYLYICGAQTIVDDLYNNFLIGSGKTHVLQFPNLADDLLDAYIIGYIDGDGSVTYKTSNKPYGTYVYPAISIIGTYDTLSGIKRRLESAYNANSRSSVRPFGKMFVYDLSGKQVSTIVERFRQIPVPKLERKWYKQL